MSEIGTLSLERLNNGAHFLFTFTWCVRYRYESSQRESTHVDIILL